MRGKKTIYRWKGRKWPGSVLQRAQNGKKSSKTAEMGSFFTSNASKASDFRIFCHFRDHRESSGPKTLSRSIFLAKDAKDAKKRLRCLKPLGELGALCERNSLARTSGPDEHQNGQKGHKTVVFRVLGGHERRFAARGADLERILIFCSRSRWGRPWEQRPRAHRARLQRIPIRFKAGRN